MATKRVKRNCGEKGVQNEPDIMAEDRISQLPDSVIYYIFSFLPTIHLVRMSRVSRRWRRMWVSTPFLYFDCHFDDVTFTEKVNRSSMFLKFVGNCLRCRKLYMQPDTFITSFKLHTYDKLGHHAAQEVDNWVRFAIQSRVKELDLQVGEYCIPQFVFTANSLTQLRFHALGFEVASLSTSSSLTQLKLRALKLESIISIEAPNLFQANLSLTDGGYGSASCFDLLHFLAKLHGLKKMKLSTFWEEDIIFPEDIRNTSSPPLPNLKHLEASLYDEHKKNSELLDFLVWCAPSVETLKINGKILL
ncbi:putative FBD-associated F-box protein At5g22720 [Ziziphus jujuba]|uniref:FBD-associated F-box protein At5g22720 n=1 Tax=Ziziphus jujuba TaxID=326968 RepID=A0ABM4A5E4_ZIZJJ|nr:putative FBD-associated F-box protein At5g22720 [Ziziphus jujuba]XP_060671949.1 putative FBD-associated F-box protein At5g22720 [Ziziphus jujuba]XP_060671950.1 putative FBD-associated F-box protein At5g22720 [Ziziphus jujuba]